MAELKQGIAAAACALLAGAVDAEEADWRIDTSYLSYSESDSRVQVGKTIVDLARERDEHALTVRLVNDTMSGASPTGALRAGDDSVTYTSASGAGFETGAGADGSLSAFSDTRIQAGADVSQPWGRGKTLKYGALVSSESDYDSFGGNVGVSRESANRNTTLDASLAMTFDTISRSDTGGTPEPLADTERARGFGEGSRRTIGTSLGLTQVLNRRTLAQASVSFTLSDGYHTDPYKVISAADDEDRVVANYTERRPDQRLRTSLYAKLVHRLSDARHSLHLSGRLYRDDWGVVSSTADLRVRRELTRRQYLEPHLRLYRQSAADFYQRNLTLDETLQPQIPADGFVSADYRLDETTSLTVGLKYGFRISPKADFRVRTEYLMQRYGSAEFDSLGAIILQGSLGYRF